MTETSPTIKDLAKMLSGWIFLIAVACLYAVTASLSPSVFANAVASFLPLLIRIMPILFLVFGLLFLVRLFVRKTWLVDHLGDASGVGGWALTVSCGILALGPLYAWYPLLGELKSKGMSNALIATFLYSRALKLPLLPLLVHYFGIAYTITLSIGIILFSVLSGLLMKGLLDHGDQSPGNL